MCSRTTESAKEAMGCPVVSRLDVVSLGPTIDGIEVFMDAAAHAADAVMIVGRVKWHTTFAAGSKAA